MVVGGGGVRGVYYVKLLFLKSRRDDFEDKHDLVVALKSACDGTL